MRRRRKSQNVHTISCLYDEPGVTLCCCWLDIEAAAHKETTDGG